MQDNEPEKRNICGSPGINLVRNDPNLLYGVNTKKYLKKLQKCKKTMNFIVIKFLMTQNFFIFLKKCVKKI